MRLIESFQDKSQARAFLNRLAMQNIEANLEERQGEKFLIWVYSEDDFDKAERLLEEFKKNPQKLSEELETSPITSEEDQKKDSPIKGPIQVKISPQLMNIRMAAPLTKWIVLMCVVLFFWNAYQKINLSKNYPSLIKYLSLTPLDTALIYDLPKLYELLEDFFKRYPQVDIEKLSESSQDIQEEFESINETPFYPGLYQFALEKVQGREIQLKAPLFRKIREGEVWRVFTPCILHSGLLHILFNMLWLWLLGKQVEQKVGKWRYLAMTLVIGVVSNSFQYLLSGPYFLGYSGIICGLAGFIWMREKIAPWEGYTIHRSILLFLGVFIVGMLLLQIVSFVLLAFHLAHFDMVIANTAHITGALCGILLAKIPFFYKVRS